ncbi:hypothetical protein ACS0TY_020807 [Phlomoides rotata]
MAAAVGFGSASGFQAQFRDNSSRNNLRNSNGKKGFKVSCVSSAAVGDPYKTLRIQHGASESEVKKAFRQLALQDETLLGVWLFSFIYWCASTGGITPDDPRLLSTEYHPDVCRGSNCGIQFHQINEAYDIVMSNLRGETSAPEMETYDEDEPMRGMYDQDWDMWEEWMGWEGAGIRDYSSHINPYI